MPTIDHNDLRELMTFVHTYAHLYETLNVEFFSARVYERVDAEWLQFMCRLDNAQLSTLPTEFEQYPECPESLRQFFACALRLSLLDNPHVVHQFCHNNNTIIACSTPAIQQNTATINGHASSLRKVKRKKAHELAAFSALLLAECAPLGIDRVVDIGCGLGHLGRILRERRHHNQCAHRQQQSSDSDCCLLDYVGLEADPALCHSALKIDGCSSADVQMENIVFGSDTSAQWQKVMTPPGRRTAIVSLHGCGELQRQILLEFVSMCNNKYINNGGDQLQQQQQQQIAPQLLITVGCCYHKIGNWTETAIDRWMLSAQMRDHFLAVYGHHQFPIPGLRLACQAKLVRWTAFTEQQHIAHRQAFANRAFVECLRMAQTATTIESNIDDDDDLLQLRRRRPPRRLNKCVNITDNDDAAAPATAFRTEVLRRCAVSEGDHRREQFEQKLDAIMEEHASAIRFIEPFTALQFALQGPLEALVLLDRLLFLHENGIGSAQLVQLFDPAVSPRNIAIVARAPTALSQSRCSIKGMEMRI